MPLPFVMTPPKIFSCHERAACLVGVDVHENRCSFPYLREHWSLRSHFFVKEIIKTGHATGSVGLQGSRWWCRKSKQLHEFWWTRSFTKRCMSRQSCPVILIYFSVYINSCLLLSNWTWDLCCCLSLREHRKHRKEHLHQWAVCALDSLRLVLTQPKRLIPLHHAVKCLARQTKLSAAVTSSVPVWLSANTFNPNHCDPTFAISVAVLTNTSGGPWKSLIKYALSKPFCVVACKSGVSLALTSCSAASLGKEGLEWVECVKCKLRTGDWLMWDLMGVKLTGWSRGQTLINVLISNMHLSSVSSRRPL